MIKVEVSNAANGLIKKVIDTQYNGADQKAEIVNVYEINEDEPLEQFIAMANFLTDLSKDLGLDFGSDFSPIQLKFDLAWGEKYNPTSNEVNEKIKSLREEIKRWKDYKEVIERNPNVNSV